MQQQADINANLFGQPKLPEPRPPVVPNHTPDDLIAEGVTHQQLQLMEMREMRKIIAEERSRVKAQREKVFMYAKTAAVVLFLILGSCWYSIYNANQTKREIILVKQAIAEIEEFQGRIEDMYRETKDDTQLYTSGIQLISTMQNAMIIEQQKKFETENANNRKNRNPKREL